MTSELPLMPKHCRVDGHHFKKRKGHDCTWDYHYVEHVNNYKNAIADKLKEIDKLLFRNDVDEASNQLHELVEELRGEK